MKVINVHRLQLQFGANILTKGSAEKQADAAINKVNTLLEGCLPGLKASLIAHRDEIEVGCEEGDDTPPALVSLSKTHKVLALQVALRMFQNAELIDLSPNQQANGRWSVDLSDDNGNIVDSFLFLNEITGVAFINLVLEISNRLNSPQYVQQ